MNLNYSIFFPIKKEILEKKNFLLQSFGLHLTIIILFYYGLPDLFRYRSEFLPPLPIEIINIADKTASPNINFDTEKDEQKDNVKYNQVEENKYNNKTDLVKDETDTVDIQKKDSKKVKKKVLKIDKLKKKPDQLQSVLRSIEQIKKDLGDKNIKKDKKAEKKEKVTPRKLGMSLTISEEDAIRRHFEKCWNIPSGAREAGNLGAEIKVRFNKEGNVIDAKIVEIGRMKRDRYFRTAAESALRAVLNPRCKNAPLPLDKFDKWKNLTLNFDPKSIIGY